MKSNQREFSTVKEHIQLHRHSQRMSDDMLVIRLVQRLGSLAVIDDTSHHLVYCPPGLLRHATQTDGRLCTDKAGGLVSHAVAALFASCVLMNGLY